mmetsp:Transcript_122258/g.351181  ORF Transcript_122258/g.351181 Transcript_122258/m.351181 type:complete len:377 (+) Transcript_122258:61-1191(+)
MPPKTSLQDTLEASSGRFMFSGWSNLNQAKGQKHVSDVIVELAGTQWVAEVYPSGTNNSKEGFVAIFATCRKGGGVGPRAQVSFRVLDYKETVHASLSLPERTFKLDEAWGFPSAFQRSLIDAVAKTTSMDRVVFTIDVVVTWASRKNGLQNLSARIGALWATGELSDVTLRVGCSELRAHRLVLSTSPVFARMLDPESPMIESVSGIITIEDSDLATMRRLCHFLYTGTLGSTDEAANVWGDHAALLALLRAAMKYQIDALARLVAEGIEATFTVQNVAECLMVSREYITPLPQMKVACLEFAIENLPAVQQTDGWARLKKDTTAAAEIMSEIIQVKFPPTPKPGEQANSTDARTPSGSGLSAVRSRSTLSQAQP